MANTKQFVQDRANLHLRNMGIGGELAMDQLGNQWYQPEGGQAFRLDSENPFSNPLQEFRDESDSWFTPQGYEKFTDIYGNPENLFPEWSPNPYVDPTVPVNPFATNREQSFDWREESTPPTYETYDAYGEEKTATMPMASSYSSWFNPYGSTNYGSTNYGSTYGGGIQSLGGLFGGTPMFKSGGAVQRYQEGGPAGNRDRVSSRDFIDRSRRARVGVGPRSEIASMDEPPPGQLEQLANRMTNEALTIASGGRNQAPASVPQRPLAAAPQQGLPFAPPRAPMAPSMQPPSPGAFAPQPQGTPGFPTMTPTLPQPNRMAPGSPGMGAPSMAPNMGPPMAPNMGPPMRPNMGPPMRPNMGPSMAPNRMPQQRPQAGPASDEFRRRLMEARRRGLA